MKFEVNNGPNMERGRGQVGQGMPPTSEFGIRNSEIPRRLPYRKSQNWTQRERRVAGDFVGTPWRAGDAVAGGGSDRHQSN